MFVVDILKENIAVREANRLNIPVFAIVDTNSDPNQVDFPIPANDDASKSISLIVNYLCEAISIGLNERKIEKDKEKDASGKEKKTQEIKPIVKRVRTRPVIVKKIEEEEEEEGTVDSLRESDTENLEEEFDEKKVKIRMGTSVDDMLDDDDEITGEPVLKKVLSKKAAVKKVVPKVKSDD